MQSHGRINRIPYQNTMSHQHAALLILRLASSSLDSEGLFTWGLFSTTGQALSTIYSGHFTEFSFPECIDGQKIHKDSVKTIVILPGQMVTSLQIQVSDAQRRHLNTALPYLIEEELTYNIEDIHLVYTPPTRDGTVSVTTVTHECMQQLQSLLFGMGVTADIVIAEQQLFYSSLGNFLYLNNNQATLSYPEEEPVTLDLAALLLILELDQAYPALDIHITEDCDQEQVHELGEWLEQHNIEHGITTHSMPNLAYLAQRYCQANSTTQARNLLQHQYKPQEQKNRHWQLWKPSLTIAASWLVLSVGIQIFQGIYFKTQAEELWMQTAQTYLKGFPGDSAINQAIADNRYFTPVENRMRSRIQASESTAVSQSFLPVLQQLSVIHASQYAATINPDSLSYTSLNGSLAIELKTSDLEQVNQFQTALNAAGLEAKLENATKEQGQLVASLTLKGSL